jgi:glycosyltransferase involved in cell wall biosynthesis
VAVNLTRFLPRDLFQVFLCTTHAGGGFAAEVAPDVIRLHVEKRRGLDISALARLSRFVRQHRIDLLHVHGYPLFSMRIAALFSGRTRFIWHDHYGGYRRVAPYRAATLGIDGVIAVNQQLADWARSRLKVPRSRVWYVPNMVHFANTDSVSTDLPGRLGRRIVCVANFKWEKDHLTLVQAMATVVKSFPDAQLLLVGRHSDRGILNEVLETISALSLSGNITILGERPDIPQILPACDIGVLSSVAEGLPVALLEYGFCGLAAVATRVGQCPDVLEHGRAGELVPSQDPQSLATALIRYLGDPALRAAAGERLRQSVLRFHGPETVTDQIVSIYSTVLNRGPLRKGQVVATCVPETR